METTRMHLGFTFDEITVDGRGYMYFTGTALEEGVWSDMYGHTAFWPRNIIHAGMEGFRGKAITCQHEASVGRILDLYPTELGFKAKGVITSKTVCNLIQLKKLKGLSVTTDAYVDPVRKIVLQLVNQQDISVVTDPACRVCMLENTWTDNMENVETETIVEVAAASEVKADVIDVVAAAPEVTLTADVVETPEIVTAELSATETTETIVADNSEMEALNMRLSAYEAQLEDYKAKIAEQEIMIAQLSAEVSVVRAQNEELAGKQREELIGAIMSADPNADKAILEKTSNDALGAYLQTVMRLSQKKVAVSAPKGMKLNEAPAQKVETVAKKPIDTTSQFIQYLKTKQ